MKLLWSISLITTLCLLTIINATNTDNEEWEENDKEILVRTIRGAKDRGSSNNNGGGSPSCRYTKAQWSECDAKNNTRTRSLTLRKGDKNCEKTKTITKKCKKAACRYEKGTFGNCINQQMVRIDTLKQKSDPTCEKSRRVTKRCKADANIKKATKDRSNKKSGKQ